MAISWTETDTEANLSMPAVRLLTDYFLINVPKQPYRQFCTFVWCIIAGKIRKVSGLPNTYGDQTNGKVQTDSQQLLCAPQGLPP